FYWIATNKRLLSTPPECHANEPDVVGMQMYLPPEQELSMMDLLRTANDEIPGETIGTVMAEDVGETAHEEETEEEEEEEDEGVEEQGGIPGSDRGNFRVEAYLRDSYSPANEVPWISEGFQPYGSNLPREENPSNGASPMPPSFTPVPQPANPEDTPVRE